MKALTITLCLLAAGFTVSSAADPAARPNIILIMSDDMGFSDIGCYGGEIKTPNLDSLAAEGIRFTQFYNTGRCCPTRGSLLTGLYPHQAGIGHMTSDYGLPQYQGELNRQCLTIAEALKPAGYRSYMSGKWHVTPYVGTREDPDRSNWPRQRGFDRFYGTIHGAGSFYDPNSLTRDNTHITPDNDPEYSPADGRDWYYTDAISDNASRYIRDHARNNADQPFFTYVAYTAAHWPMHALPEDIAEYDGKYDDGYSPVREARIKKLKQLQLLPDHWQVSPQVGDWSAIEKKEWESACMEVYAAMVDVMDRGIGRIVDTLKETGQYENTLIMFFQDNGGCAETFGRGKLVGPLERPSAPTLPPMAVDQLQTEMIPPQSRDGYPLRRGDGVMPGPPETEIGYGRNWANVSNTPFREYKHWVHEGGISTPLIVHWPRGYAKVGPKLGPNLSNPGGDQGLLYTSPAHLIDLMATALDLSGAEYPLTYKGEKLIPVEGVSLATAFSGEPLKRGKPIYWEHEGNRAVRDGKWKLVAKGVDGPWELYDMEKDRTEMNDLSATHPDIANKMAEQYQTWASERGVVPFGSWKKGKENSKGAKKTHFEIKTGDTFDQVSSPFVVNRAFTVNAEIDELPATGVIAAQGGTNHGWSFYIGTDQQLHFTTRTHGTEFTASAPLPEATKLSLQARILKNKIILRADNKRLTIKEGSPLILSQPLDVLEIGKDSGGAVGPYDTGNAFSGKINGLTLDLK